MATKTAEKQAKKAKALEAATAEIVKQPPLVLSYLRFSHPQQALGDSVRRQLERTDSWVERKGLTLAEGNRFEDKGLSAFRGKHKAVGVLSKILTLIQTGTLPKGSYLLIENLDRLTREETFEAVDLCFSIIKGGVTIVTIDDDREYNRQAVNDNPMLLTLLVAELSRGNRESKRKSDLVGAAWRRKKSKDAAEGKVITEAVPAWLEVKDGKVVGVPWKVKVVQEIFDLAMGGRGSHFITRYLNANYPNISNRKVGKTDAKTNWSSTYVLLILQNKAVIGEYQPTKLVYDEETGAKSRAKDGPPLKGYYPKVIEPTVFYAVQKKIEERRGTGGQQSEAVVNLWNGILVDPIENTIVSKTQPNWRRNYIYGSLDNKGLESLTPDQKDAYNLHGKSVYFPANEFDFGLLFRLVDLEIHGKNANKALPNPNDKDAIAELRKQGKELSVLATTAEEEPKSDELVAVDNEIAETENNLVELGEAIKKKPLATLIRAIEDLELNLEALNRRRRDLLANQVSKVKTLGELFGDWQEGLEAVRKGTLSQERRLLLRDSLRSQVSKIHAVMLKDGWQGYVASLHLELTPRAAQRIGESELFWSFRIEWNKEVEAFNFEFNLDS